MVKREKFKFCTFVDFSRKIDSNRLFEDFFGDLCQRSPKISKFGQKFGSLYRVFDELVTKNAILDGKT